MIDHMSTYATDFEATKAFYVAVLGALGYGIQLEMTFDEDPDLPGRRAVSFGPPARPVFWVIEAREAYTPRHVAFSAGTRAAVDAFHAAGLGAGGSDNGAPGVRAIYHPDYYGGFLLDPDGNNVEAVCHTPG